MQNDRRCTPDMLTLKDLTGHRSPSTDHLSHATAALVTATAAFCGLRLGTAFFSLSCFSISRYCASNALRDSWHTVRATTNFALVVLRRAATSPLSTGPA